MNRLTPTKQSFMQLIAQEIINLENTKLIHKMKLGKTIANINLVLNP